MRFRKIVACLVGAMIATGNLHAETLKISGLYPAEQADTALLQSISVENFGGQDGDALGFAIEEKLRAVAFETGPYFTVMAGRSAADPGATLSGTATARVNEYHTREYRSRCVERNDKDKCVKRKSIKVPCLKRVIDFSANVRLSRFSDGQTIYRDTKTARAEQTNCEEYSNFKSREGEIRKMIDSAAYAVRRDLAPIQLTQKIRILESRKGMEKAVSRAFRAAIKMTKKDDAEACRMFSETAANGAPHGSLAFNTGLCAEQEGDFETALLRYDEANNLLGGKGEVDEGIRRIRDKQRAASDWNARIAAINDAQSGEASLADAALPSGTD